MYRIRKSYSIEYAHQLKHAFTSCCHETIHGHSGVVELFFECDVLNDDKMVVDFGEVSKLIKPYIMTYDHALFMPSDMDPAYLETLGKFNTKLTITRDNPTAESFAEIMYWDIKGILTIAREDNPGWSWKLTAVRFHETTSGYAEYSE
jgi:6-pyruvoyl-tetrahydropterin synthase